MSTVTFRGLSKSYGTTEVIRDLDLSIASGSFTTILGPSGSGKTTILSMIAGIAAVTSGRIEVDGRDISALPAAARNIGVVFQSYALFPHLTVADNIAFPLRLRRMGRDAIRRKVDEMLRLVRMEGLADRKPDALSGGQQQRVAIARALVFAPDILLLDEPLSALDRKLREEVREEIHRIQRSLGITTIMVTHDQEEALSLSDAVVVLNDGLVQQCDAPQGVYRRPSNRFVATFLGTANLFDAEVSGGSGDRAVELCGRRLPLRVDAATGPAVAMLRPDRIALADEGGAGAGGPGVEITRSVFLGGTMQYTTRLDDGTEVQVHVMGEAEPRPVGSRARLDWAPEDIWLLPAEPAARHV